MLIAVKNLYHVAKAKLALSKMGIENIEIGPKGARVRLVNEPNINLGRLMEYKMMGSDTFTVKRDMLEPEERFALLDEIIVELTIK